MTRISDVVLKGTLYVRDLVSPVGDINGKTLRVKFEHKLHSDTHSVTEFYDSQVQANSNGLVWEPLKPCFYNNGLAKTFNDALVEQFPNIRVSL